MAIAATQSNLDLFFEEEEGGRTKFSTIESRINVIRFSSDSQESFSPSLGFADFTHQPERNNDSPTMHTAEVTTTVKLQC